MFAQQGKNGLKIAVHGVLGEIFREKRRLRASAGRTLSRKGTDAPRAGRDFSRKRRLRASAGRTLSWGRMCLVLGECCRVQGTGVFFWVTRR